MGFPILRLPYLAFENVYQHLDVADIIFLAQCSQKMKDRLRSQATPKRDRKIDLCIFNGHSAIRIITGEYTEEFTWHLEASENPKPEDDKEVINEDGAPTESSVTWKVAKPDSTWKSAVKKEYYEVKLLAIINMLRELFNCRFSSIYFCPQESALKLLFETDVLHRADSIRIHTGKYSPEQVDFMLDNFTTDWLHFAADGGPNYSYQKPLKFPELYLFYATWIDMKILLELTNTGRVFGLEKVTLITDKDLNKLIKWWLDSDNKILKFVYVQRQRHECDQAVLMEGIPSIPGHEKQEDIVPNTMMGFRYENGRDIRRKDGMLATVLVQHGFFVLAIWHHPNPNVEESDDEEVSIDEEDEESSDN